MFGRQARLPIELTYGTLDITSQPAREYAAALQRMLGSAYERGQKNFKFKLFRQKDFYDRMIYGEPYERDSLVWLHSVVVPKGQSHKLHHPWTGPYHTVKDLSDVTYRIQHARGRKQRLVVHFDQFETIRRGDLIHC